MGLVLLWGSLLPRAERVRRGDWKRRRAVCYAYATYVPSRRWLERGTGDQMGQKTLQVETVAQAWLELLHDRGVDVFLANAGTDFASLVDAFAKRHAEGKASPRPMFMPYPSVPPSIRHRY